MKSPHSESANEFEVSLRRCREVAEAEYAVASEALEQAQATANAAREKIANLLSKMPAVAGQNGGMKDMISRSAEEIAYQMEHLLGGTLRMLHAKRSRLGKFTIALFGKSKAGKSTFREAITGGNGSSIGKGAQNTTKRTREYPWNGLHIIDTPGIGSYKGDRYNQQATSVIGKSDVVLFMLSDDGISKEVFEGMKEILKENKPVFFVLNVKRKLDEELLRKRFLENPDALMGMHRIGGHHRRIKTLAVDHLGMHEPRVFSIHANAAYLATQSGRESKALHEASRIQTLYSALSEEVSINGPVRRLQTILDGAIGALEGINEFYHDQSAKLKSEARLFEKKKDEFSEQSANFIKDHRKQIKAGVAEAFAPLKAQVFEFIEENIERKNILDLWNERVKSSNIDVELQKIQKTAVSTTEDLVRDFKREFQIDAEFSEFDASTGNPERADIWDLRKGFGRGAAVAGVLSAIALFAVELGAPNFWNPVGWTLMGVSVVAGIVAWFMGKKSEHLSKAKNNAREKLNKQIGQRTEVIQNTLLKWFKKEIEGKLIGSVLNDLDLAYTSLQELAGVLNSAERLMKDGISRLNLRLLSRATTLNGVEVNGHDLTAVSRRRGIACRAIGVKTIDHCLISKVAGSALRENVGVIPDGTREEIVRASLRPAHILGSRKRGNKWIVRIRQKEIEKLRPFAESLLDLTMGLFTQKCSRAFEILP